MRRPLKNISSLFICNAQVLNFEPNTFEFNKSCVSNIKVVLETELSAIIAKFVQLDLIPIHLKEP